MSPNRSNIANVWSFFRTCGCSSVLADVAATYHLSPIWIFWGMRCLSARPAPAYIAAAGLRGDACIHQLAVNIQVVPGHDRRREPLFEHLAAAAPVDAA